MSAGVRVGRAALWLALAGLVGCGGGAPGGLGAADGGACRDGHAPPCPTPCPTLGVCEAASPRWSSQERRWLCGLEDLPDYEPRETRCDGLDNDCDGLTDRAPDGRPLAPTAQDCPRLAHGVCADPGGVVRAACDRGRWTCAVDPEDADRAGYEPKETRCDGLDNDCDGLTDEGLITPQGLRLGQPCDGDDQDACPRGVVACLDGVPACREEGPGLTERCNAVDDDCDGLTDEDTCDDGDACTLDRCDAPHGGGAPRCRHELAPAGTPCGPYPVAGACDGGGHCLGVERIQLTSVGGCAWLQRGDVRCWGWPVDAPPIHDDTSSYCDDVDFQAEYPLPSPVAHPWPFAFQPTSLAGIGSPASPPRPGALDVVHPTCASTDQGEVFCWGRTNASTWLGQAVPLSDWFPEAAGFPSQNPLPPRRVPLPQPARRVLGSTYGSAKAASEPPRLCALLEEGSLACWWGDLPQLGPGPGDIPLPAPVGARLLEATPTSGLSVDGAVLTWGRDTWGAWGVTGPCLDGQDQPLALPSYGAWPVPVPLGTSPTVKIGWASQRFEGHYAAIAALAQDGTVRRWGGDRDPGESGSWCTDPDLYLGDDPDDKPLLVPLAAPARDLACGLGSAWYGPACCAVLVDGRVQCWGLLGREVTGSIDNQFWADDPGELPLTLDLGGPAAAIDALGARFCALMENRHVKCWAFDGCEPLAYGNPRDWAGSEDAFPPPNVNLFGAPGSYCQRDDQCLSSRCEDLACAP